MARIVDRHGDSIVPSLVPPATEPPFPLPHPPSPESALPDSDSSGPLPSAAKDASPETSSADTALPGVRKPGSQRLPPSQLAPRLPAKGRMPATTWSRPTLLDQAIRFHLKKDSSPPDWDSSDSDSSDGEPSSSPLGTARGREPRKERKGAPAGEKAVQEALKQQEQREKEKRESHRFSRFAIGNEHFWTRGKVSKSDGRLKISINEATSSGYLSKALGSGLRHHLFLYRGNDGDERPPQVSEAERYEESAVSDGLFEREGAARPKMNIVIIVIGSRGDIQPFLKIGKVLKEKYGHRVRIATHPSFKKFVEHDSGLEFFSVGGDPSELMAFMVKNPGLIPSLETVRAGEVGRRRAEMFDMFKGMWRACINATGDETDKGNMKMMGDKDPFVADAIIANPPSFAHVHIAERLGIPLHMMFTFPCSPTVQFPHPLANIQRSNVDQHYTNFMSYMFVEMMQWQGLGDLVNKFRVETLGLEPASTLWAPGRLYRMKVPHTYMWSPDLVPKPSDWGPEINTTGFVFLELAASFQPPEGLVSFLEAGSPPVYIGFGSIVVDDPNGFTKKIFDAVEMAGVRALVSKGWGGLGGDGSEIPENIHLLDNTPHDWLFPRVAAVVHHGGAGTTAIGLKCGKPTLIVSFFGDQPFWGDMVSGAKAGAHEYIPYKSVTAERLAEGIKQCLTDEARRNAARLAESIAKEGDGAENAVRAFHRSLPLRGDRSMRCSILEDRVACWQLKALPIRLSPLAAEILVERKIVRWHDLTLLRVNDWNDFAGPGEPLTGTSSAIIGTLRGVVTGVGSIPMRMKRSVTKRAMHQEKKRKALDKQKRQNQGNGSATRSGVDPSRQAEELAGYDDRPLQLRRQSTTLSRLSADPVEPLWLELDREARAGVRGSGKALLTAPTALALAVAQGFHNAPRLYGDATVRRSARVTDFRSGLRAGKDEFVYGVYDGVTGLWRHPARGFAQGPAGFVKGVGLGIGGFVLKDVAAIIGPIAYALKGIEKEMGKKRDPTHCIRTARMAQGRKDKQALREGRVADTGDAAVQERDAEDKVERGWEIIEDVLQLVSVRRAQGLKGRFILRQKMKEWEKAGATESVWTAQEALKAREEGRRIGRGAGAAAGPPGGERAGEPEEGAGRRRTGEAPQ